MDIYGNKLVNTIKTKPLCASLSNLADMLTMVNPIDFGGHNSKVKVTMGIIDKCGVRWDATLCVVIFLVCNFVTEHIKKTNYGQILTSIGTLQISKWTHLFSTRQAIVILV